MRVRDSRYFFLFLLSFDFSSAVARDDNDYRVVFYLFERQNVIIITV